MSYTVPNQKIIHIHRAPLGSSFLGINIDNVKNAARTLSASAFKLYIYLATNKDDFKLALSPAAIQRDIGMARSTFYDQCRVLESLGYLVKGKGNLYHFYENPSPLALLSDERDSLKSTEENHPPIGIAAPSQIQNPPQEDIEIYINNKENLTNIPKGVLNTRPQKEKSLSELRKDFHF